MEGVLLDQGLEAMDLNLPPSILGGKSLEKGLEVITTKRLTRKIKLFCIVRTNSLNSLSFDSCLKKKRKPKKSHYK